jgi:outer membrane lipoprotein-sorting protein
MKTFIRVLALTLFVLPLSTKLASADTVKDIPAESARVESYLNSLGRAKARFVQTSHNGIQLQGDFYLDRPGKLRFNYDAPMEDYVVADGFFIYFYDAELGEQTNAPIGQTLADFLLRDNISLSDDITVDNIKRGGGYLQVILSQTNDPGAGALHLAFKEDSSKNNALTLNKWRVIDAQGLITEVELSQLKTNIDLPRGLFSYQDPNHGQGGTYNE